MIIEVLLGQDKIIEALRLAISLSGAENLSARKYLEAAKKKGDPIVFYTIYTWFQQRNIRQRGSPDFLTSIYQFCWLFAIDNFTNISFHTLHNCVKNNKKFSFCLQTNSVKNIRIIFKGSIVVKWFVSTYPVHVTLIIMCSNKHP